MRSAVREQGFPLVNRSVDSEGGEGAPEQRKGDGKVVHRMHLDLSLDLHPAKTG